MARIRSVHPGLFTDEAFMQLSDAARMLLIGLWTEADDQGVFEWKPLTLKARLRPADDGSVEPLLDAIVAQDLVKRIEVDGRSYGLVRNFRKFQRPQKPNAIHPLPDQYRTYIGLVQEEEDSPPRKSPQMEDVGGKREEKDEGKKEVEARATRLPTDWKPDDDDWKFALGEGLTVPEVETEAAKFLDYWTAKGGKDGRKLDWKATWRNWIRNRRTGPQHAASPGGAMQNHLVGISAALARASR